jgi:hypothetical protein
MSTGNLSIVFEVNDHPFRKKLYIALRGILKLQFRWTWFIRPEYWWTWVLTAKVLIEGYRRKE